MQLWAQGKSSIDVDPRVGDGRLLVVIDGRLEPVMKSDVSEYCDDHFWSVMGIWNKWKTIGVGPFSGGWAEWPAHITEALEVAEMAYNETQMQRKKHGSR